MSYILLLSFRVHRGEVGSAKSNSFIHGIFQERVLEWVAISFSRIIREINSKYSLERLKAKGEEGSRGLVRYLSNQRWLDSIID